MPVASNLAYGVDGDVFLGGRGQGRLEISLDLLQDFAIHDEFFRAGDEATLQPSGGVVDHVDTGLHRRPQRVAALPDRLPVGHIGGTGVGGTQGKPVVPAHLAGHLGGPHVFRGAEGRRTGAHVDIRGEGSEHARRSGPDHLHQGDGCQPLGD